MGDLRRISEDREPAGSAGGGELLARAAAGSEEASAELVDAYWPAVHRVAVLILRDHQAAEDVAQETMLSALEGAGRFDDDRPLQPWLIRIATNKALDQTRRRARRPEESLPEIAAEVSDDPATLDGLQERLEALDPETRALVVLRYVLDYRSHEIGEIVGMTAAAVRTRLRRALKTLRIQIEAEEVRNAC